MGKRYDQLDLDDRIEIGHLMGRNASTISRELRRNSLPRGEYKTDQFSEAREALATAEEALRDGDWDLFGRAMQELKRLLGE